jgi:hypothetical protein
MEKPISIKAKYTHRYDQMDKGDGCEDFMIFTQGNHGACPRGGIASSN